MPDVPNNPTYSAVKSSNRAVVVDVFFAHLFGKFLPTYNSYT